MTLNDYAQAIGGAGLMVLLWGGAAYICVASWLDRS